MVSPYQGRVLELLAQRGTVLGAGAPVVSLELESDELVAIVYIPAGQGKRVRPGMAAEITPSVVKREEHGSMLGTVRSVASAFQSRAPPPAMTRNKTAVISFFDTG